MFRSNFGKIECHDYTFHKIWYFIAFLVKSSALPYRLVKFGSF